MIHLRDTSVTVVCKLLSWAFRLLARNKEGYRDIESLLILKPCCIGDVLFTTAAVAQLRAGFPKARISFAVGSWSGEMVANNPHIDDVIDCEGVSAGAGVDISAYVSFIKMIQRRCFDACFVLDRSPLLTLIPFLAGIPIRVGLDSQGRGFSLTHKVSCRKGRHEVDLYLDTVRALGIEPRAPRMEFFPTEADMITAAEIMSPLSGGAFLDKACEPLVAIHSGGGTNPGIRLFAKRWMTEHFATITEQLLAHGAKVLFIGAESDRPVTEKVKSNLHGKDKLDSARLLDITGMTTLGQLGAVLQRCQLFVGNDTGPMHLAVAVGTLAIGIFGPSDPSLNRPYSPKSRIVYKGVPCSPCYVNGRVIRKCTDHTCMEQISVDDVWREVKEVLDTLPGQSEGRSLQP